MAVACRTERWHSHESTNERHGVVIGRSAVWLFLSPPCIRPCNNYYTAACRRSPKPVGMLFFAAGGTMATTAGWSEHKTRV